jgi:ElaB/YqjD/DUF883 family membrane-anchored ribosome-binding protein
MADEPEVIRRQMAATRSDLTRKIEALEHQVVETVQSTTSAVTNTVASVRDAVQDTVSAVKGTVSDTVCTVKDTVSETVASVKETLDVRRRVEDHPWAAFGAAVAAGFVGGRLFGGGHHAQGDRIVGLHSRGEPFPARRPSPNGAADDRRALVAGAARADFSAAPAHADREPGWLDTLQRQFAPEIDKVKGLALGALGAVVRDVLTQSAPPQFQTQLSGLVDDFTRKIGGEPMRGNPFQGDANAGKTSRERDVAHEARRDRAAV